MAGRSAPTVRRIRLGTELRKLRERADMKATEGAHLIGISQAQLSNIESGRFGVSPERVRAMTRNYRCSDPAYVDGLVSLTGERRGGWWETYRDVLPSPLLDLAELDRHAQRLRAANIVHVPGLLQTTDHAREIFRQVVPEYSRTDLEHRVSHRLQRQSILDRDDPPPFHSAIHEAALRVPVGGPSVARQQLKHLLEQSEREHITIRVIPFAIGAYPGSGQTIYYVHGDVPQLDTVHLDQSHGPSLVDAEAQLERYRMLLDRIESVALTPPKSRDLVRAIAHDL